MRMPKLSLSMQRERGMCEDGGISMEHWVSK